MRIVKLKGGLGNQMFQYAFAKNIEQYTGEAVKLDFSAYSELGNDSIRVPRICKYNLTLQAASRDDIASICTLNHKGNSQSFRYRVGIYLEKTFNKRYMWEPDRKYREITSLIDRYDYFDGYWQAWKYVEQIREILEKDFTPNYELSKMTRDTVAAISSENAVFIGVRRGDYSKEIKHYGSFSSQYYQDAMRYIAERSDNPVFYVFSNDIEWCKKSIKWGKHNVVFREKEQQTDDFEELQLMTLCKHAIIVNSSFNWWGAALIQNQNKIVCCPAQWWLDNKPIDIIPPNWIRISI